eukprot:6179735-Pleurochrysis_carterae.AAC.1
MLNFANANYHRSCQSSFEGLRSPEASRGPSCYFCVISHSEISFICTMAFGVRLSKRSGNKHTGEKFCALLRSLAIMTLFHFELHAAAGGCSAGRAPLASLRHTRAQDSRSQAGNARRAEESQYALLATAAQKEPPRSCS